MCNSCDEQEETMSTFQKICIVFVLGWLLNLAKVYMAYTDDPTTWEPAMLWQAVGVIAAPLGGVLGWIIW